MAYGYVAYVDEAGDDGIGQFRAAGLDGQSHWLVLSACLIAAEHERSVVGWRDEIGRAFPKRQKRGLHFRDLNHEQRMFAASKLGEWPVGILTVASYKPTILHTTMAKQCAEEKNLLYKYLLRYVLEKVTWTAHRREFLKPSLNGKVKIVFSRRGGMDYDDFKYYMDYLKDLQSKKGGAHTVKWDCLEEDSLVVDTHSSLAGLQLADIAASSFFQALEINRYGMTEPRYALALEERVVRAAGKDGKRLYWGMKPVPSIGRMTLTREQHAFFQHWG